MHSTNATAEAAAVAHRGRAVNLHTFARVTLRIVDTNQLGRDQDEQLRALALKKLAADGWSSAEALFADPDFDVLLQGALNESCADMGVNPSGLHAEAKLRSNDYPDASLYNSSPDYVRGLVEAAKERQGLSQRAVADTIGVGWTSLKDWMAGKAKIPYACQFSLERLAQKPAHE